MKKLQLIPPSKRIEAEVQIPGSKSYTNRAIIIAALAEGRSVLKNISLGDDSRVLIAALQKLGVKIGAVDCIEGAIEIYGTGGKFAPTKKEIDVGAAGTVMRFLTSLCAIIEGGEIILRGSERMHERPIDDLISALQGMGAEIEYLEKKGCPPLKIRGRESVLQGKKKIVLKGDGSSQFLTSLLLISPLFTEGLEIDISEKLVSKSYVDMTLEVMRNFGVEVQNKSYKHFIVSSGQKYRSCTYMVEADLDRKSVV